MENSLIIHNIINYQLAIKIGTIILVYIVVLIKNGYSKK